MQPTRQLLPVKQAMPRSPPRIQATPRSPSRRVDLSQCFDPDAMSQFFDNSSALDDQSDHGSVRKTLINDLSVMWTEGMESAGPPPAPYSSGGGRLPHADDHIDNHRPYRHQRRPAPGRPPQPAAPAQPDLFFEMLRAIELRYGGLPKAVRIRVERWVAKLAYHVDNPTWMKERNL